MKKEVCLRFYVLSLLFAVLAAITVFGLLENTAFARANNDLGDIDVPQINLSGPCCTCICDGCVRPEHKKFRKIHAPIEFEEHRRLLIEDMFVGYILPAMMKMTEQITVMAMHQVQMIGAFLDAKEQLEAQQLIQELQAQAHKDYRPSREICEMGSASKSLLASDARSDWTKIVLSHRSMQRQLGTVGVAAQGKKEDRESRLQHYRDNFCDPRNNNRGLAALCKDKMGNIEADRDIDYSRTVSNKSTLDINFLDNGGGATEDEKAVFELQSYLYGHDVFTKIPGNYLKNPPNPKEGLNPLQELYLEARSVIAKRMVAENSFDHIVAMKAKGTGAATEYIKFLMKDIAIPDSEIAKILGDEPSYYMQMKVLTEIIPYNPDFYVNLYDTPTNVLRKRVALQAIGVLQKWDTLESMWRSEMTAAVAASIRLDDLQQDVENKLTRIRGEK